MEIKIFKEKTELLHDGRFWYENAFQNKLSKYNFLTKKDIIEKIAIKNNVDKKFIKKEFKKQIEDAFKSNNDKVLYKKLLKELDFNIQFNSDLLYKDISTYQTRDSVGNYSLKKARERYEKESNSFRYNVFFYDYKNKNIYYYPSAEKLISHNKREIDRWYKTQQERYKKEGWDKPNWITDYENNNYYIEEFKAEEETMSRNNHVKINVYDEEFNLEVWNLYFLRPDNNTIELHKKIEKDNKPYYDTINWMIEPDDKTLWSEIYEQNLKIWKSFWDSKNKNIFQLQNKNRFLYI